MALFNKAVSPFKNLRDKALLSGRKHATCPKCGYNPEDATKPHSLPVGMNPGLLLDSSPTPQLLLSESNVIIYANKSAARLFRVMKEDPPLDEEETTKDPHRSLAGSFPGAKRLSIGTTGSNESNDAETSSMKDGLRGHTIDQLNMDISDKDMRRWITLIQVFENIKIHLARRQAKLDGKDTHEAEMYGEGPKYSSYDYYGDLERLAKRNGVNADKTLRDTCAVSIERDDGSILEAIISISLVPTGSHVDATFTPMKQKRRRTRDRIMTRLSGQYQHQELDDTDSEASPADDYVTGHSGEDLIHRVARIKDMILDEMDYCFIALSPDGDVVITNKTTKAVLGVQTLKASMGEGFDWIARLDIWRPDFSERLPFEEWALNTLLTSHKPLTQVIGLRSGDSKIVVELRGKCIWENSEKQEGLLAALAVIVDQTAWFSKEKSMKTTQMKQGYFLSNISRALKSPVAGIVGLLELLYANGSLNEDQRSWIRQIFGSVNQLLLVVNDIIDFNRIESGAITITRQTFILQDLVDELKILFLGSMGHQGVTFEVDSSRVDRSAFGDGTRLVLLGDDEKIKRSCINLLSNAFKYTVKGKVTLTISTYAVKRNVINVKFEIRDTGSGISSDDLKKLFVPLDEMTSEGTERMALQKTGGTGIGLSIVQKFVSLLGGTLGCNSELDVGSTFWFSVPCGRPPLDKPPILGPKKMTLSSTMGMVISSHELERDPSIPHEARKQTKVLIDGTLVMLVEDNWATQMVMEKRLARLGCEVIVAVSAQNALNILKKPKTQVDVIFMALQMSLLDGYEATKLIRTDPSLARWKNIPVVGVNATEVKGDAEKAEEYGLNEYLVKPISDEDLEDIIGRVMDPIALGTRRRSGKPSGNLPVVPDGDDA